MSVKPVMRDERTVSVENASYRLAYLVMSYGLLVAVMYRGLVLKQQAWDLMALVIVGGFVATAYQGSKGILTSRSAKIVLASMVAAAVIAAAIVFTRR
jgi:hypothetical protein